MHIRAFVSRCTLIALTAVVATGCGGSGDSEPKSTAGKDNPEGKAIFVETCGGCHTLSDADTSGASGPGLDGAGLDADRVAAQIELGGGGMPAGLVEGADRDAVAKYVAAASAG